MSRDNIELIISGVVLCVGVIAITVMYVLGVSPPDILLGLVSAFAGAFLKELGESGQLAKSERVLGKQELVVTEAVRG